MPGQNSHHWDTILSALAGGPIEDPSGLATQKLMAETGHSSTNALTKILARMEAEGLVERDISGRRTTRIGLTAAGRRKARRFAPALVEPLAEPQQVAVSDGVDYDLLAAALLAKALKATQIQEGAAANKDAVARAERAEARLKIAEADAQAARTKVADLESQIRQMEKNISVLQAAADRRPARSGTQVADLISPAEKRALEDLRRIMQTPPGRD